MKINEGRLEGFEGNAFRAVMNGQAVSERQVYEQTAADAHRVRKTVKGAALKGELRAVVEDAQTIINRRKLQYSKEVLVALRGRK